jgi:hypothetical protein
VRGGKWCACKGLCCNCRPGGLGLLLRSIPRLVGGQEDAGLAAALPLQLSIQGVQLPLAQRQACHGCLYSCTSNKLRDVRCLQPHYKVAKRRAVQHQPMITEHPRVPSML